MENEHIINRLNAHHAHHIIAIDSNSDMLSITIQKNAVHDILSFMKNTMGFSFLTTLCGIHYPEQELQLGVVYHLHNLTENNRIRLKAYLPIDEPKIDSCVDIFSAANWMEREAYDFYGIEFINHPNLMRILNVECMNYFPMRKEYPLEDATRTDKDDKFFGR
ncbi:MAG: NADH-quinone oxidoreductase subunit C [Bacteroidota bacterium]